MFDLCADELTICLKCACVFGSKNGSKTACGLFCMKEYFKRKVVDGSVL